MTSIIAGVSTSVQTLWGGMGKKQRTTKENVELVWRSVRTLASKRDNNEDPWGPAMKEQHEDLTQCLEDLRRLVDVRGLEEEDDGKDKAQLQELSQLVADTGVMKDLVQNIELIDFEGRKTISLIFRQLLKRFATAEEGFSAIYLKNNPSMLTDLIRGYESLCGADAPSASCGQILRDCVQHEDLARVVLEWEDGKGVFELLQTHVRGDEFDVASDAFASLRDLLLVHKALVADFLERKFDDFFRSYEGLLKSENYATKRQSLRLLCELLMARENQKVMTKYIEDPEKLKVMMNLLKDKRKSICFDAFHVFKVFVQNPQKKATITGILAKNKEKLIQFISNFDHNYCDCDDKSSEDCAEVIKTIKNLKTDSPPAAAPAAASSPES